ncbi:MAG: hypothetical protein WKF86_00200 [Acidimicrobiales bacterium]
MAWLIGGVLLGWTAGLTGWLFAASEDSASPFDPASPVTWVSFGVAGVVTVAFAREWVVTGSALRRAEERAKISEAALREGAPALAEANVVQGKMLAYLAGEGRRREGQA